MKITDCQDPKSARKLLKVLRTEINKHAYMNVAYYGDIEIVLEILKVQMVRESNTQYKYGKYVTEKCL